MGVHLEPHPPPRHGCHRGEGPAVRLTSMGSTAMRNESCSQFHTRPCTNLQRVSFFELLCCAGNGWMGGWTTGWLVGWIPLMLEVRSSAKAFTCSSLVHTHARLGASLPMLSEGFVPVMAAVPPSPSLHKHTSTGAHAEAPCSGARLPTPAPSSVHTLVRALTHSAQLTGRGQTIHTDRKQQGVRNIKPLLLASRFSPPEEKPNSLQAS